jgi:hypothetical protein
MNAKEKAKDLFDKMYFETTTKYDAKQCALIAVDEIINEFYTHPVAKMYWQEVKQEIEKL